MDPHGLDGMDGRFEGRHERMGRRDAVAVPHDRRHVGTSDDDILADAVRVGRVGRVGRRDVLTVTVAPDGDLTIVQAGRVARRVLGVGSEDAWRRRGRHEAIVVVVVVHHHHAGRSVEGSGPRVVTVRPRLLTMNGRSGDGGRRRRRAGGSGRYARVGAEVGIDVGRSVDDAVMHQQETLLLKAGLVMVGHQVEGMRRCHRQGRGYRHLGASKHGPIWSGHATVALMKGRHGGGVIHVVMMRHR